VGRRFLTASLIVLMWTGQGSTQIIPFVVIVNNANPVKSLTTVELRRIFMKQSRMWQHGEQMVPVDWDSTHYLRSVFSRDVMERTVREMQEYWVQQSMTQGLTPPSTQRSARAVLRFVASVPGAISYVPPSEVDETVRAVPIE
jgi:ABC-type phosphate transport system substrate-binding protein